MRQFRSYTVAALAVGIGIVLTVGTARAAPVPHPRGAAAVVLHVETSSNYFGGGYEDGATVTVYGDVRIIIQPQVLQSGRASPEPQVVQAGERTVQRILHRARKIGLLRATPRDYGHAGVTDQGTTTVEIHAAGIDRTVDVYALLLPDGDHGLPAAQRHARRALRAFVHDLTHGGFWAR